MSNSTKTRMSFILSTSIAKEVKKYSKILSRPQSSIVENAIQIWLERLLDNDTKELSTINFDDLPNENEWALIQSKV